MFSKWRVRLKIEGRIAYISHLDLISALQRALRRADLPMRYSEGFNPHMIMAFGPAHAVGVIEDCQYCDLEFAFAPPADWQKRLNHYLPDGISLVQAREIDDRCKSLTACINLAVYEFIFASIEGEPLDLRPGVEAFLAADTLPVERISPKGRKTVDIRPAVLNIDIKDDDRLLVCVRLGLSAIPKPQELALAIAPKNILVSVRRCGQFIEDEKGRYLP
jgi:radical SAM-linked protein